MTSGARRSRASGFRRAAPATRADRGYTVASASARSSGDRALPCGGRGRKFESCRAHSPLLQPGFNQVAVVAQRIPVSIAKSTRANRPARMRAVDGSRGRRDGATTVYLPGTSAIRYEPSAFTRVCATSWPLWRNRRAAPAAGVRAGLFGDTDGTDRPAGDVTVEAAVDRCRAAGRRAEDRGGGDDGHDNPHAESMPRGVPA